MKLPAFCIAASLLIATPALAASITVQSTDSIFKAGGNASTGSDNGTTPSGFSFAGGAGQTLTFQSVTGSWACCVGNTDFNGPDGGQFAGGQTNINSAGRIAGIVNSNATMFLVGVFLDAGLPASAPARLNFSATPGGLGTSFASLTPGIGQVFFIGDGRTGTGSGATQQFIVPTSATRLFLGVADGFAFTGDSAAYNDNQGSLLANFTITGGNPNPNPVPEPATLALLALSAFGLALGRSRRRR